MKIKGIVVFISLISLFTISCGILKPVTVKGISNFKTVNTGTSPEFRFDLSLYNPNKFSVTIKTLDVGI